MKLICFICMIAVTVHCNGQFHFGAIAGISNNWISIKNYTSSTFVETPPIGTSVTYTDNKNASGNAFFGGAKAILDLNSSISVSAELLLGNMAYNQHVQARILPNNIFPATDSTFGNDIFKLLYLSLPVYIQFYAPVGHSRLYIGAGGYLSYGLVGSDEFNLSYSSLSNITDSISQITFSNDEKYKSVVFRANRFDYGVSVVAGLQLRNNFFIEGAFDDGLHSIFKDKFLVEDKNRTYYNFPNKKRTFRLGIGYLFN